MRLVLFVEFCFLGFGFLVFSFFVFRFSFFSFLAVCRPRHLLLTVPFVWCGAVCVVRGVWHVACGVWLVVCGELVWCVVSWC